MCMITKHGAAPHNYRVERISRAQHGICSHRSNSVNLTANLTLIPCGPAPFGRAQRSLDRYTAQEYKEK
jgi:hypothetical protein